MTIKTDIKPLKNLDIHCCDCKKTLIHYFKDSYTYRYSLPVKDIYVIDNINLCRQCVKNCCNPVCNTMLKYKDDNIYCNYCYIIYSIKNTSNNITKKLPFELVDKILNYVA